MSSSSDLPARKVLLVDDEPAVIHVTKRMLEMGGYAVTTATSAEEGLRLFDSQIWDLVVTDRSMPGMDGEEMASLMKARAPQMPFLMITGYPETVVYPERYVAVVRKPFASAELLAHVARTLGKTT